METKMETKKADIKTPEKKLPVTEPWKPAAVLTVGGKKEGYGYRWVREDQINKRLAEGWVLVKKGEVDAPLYTPIESRNNPEDDNVRRQELTLMRIPENIAEMRDQYYRDLGNSAINEHAKSYEETQKNLASGTKGGAIGEIKIKVGE